MLFTHFILIALPVPQSAYSISGGSAPSGVAASVQISTSNELGNNEQHLSTSVDSFRRFRVLLPTSSIPEHSKSIPGQQLPYCNGNSWKVEGSTNDGIAKCTTNANLKLRINPFRCRRYAQGPSNDGIIDCKLCNYGFSSLNSTKEIFVYETESTSAKSWFIGKGYSPSAPKVTTCLIVSDVDLLAECGNIQDEVISGKSTKSFCMNSSQPNNLPTEFLDRPLTELNATQCRSFIFNSNAISCQTSIR